MSDVLRLTTFGEALRPLVSIVITTRDRREEVLKAIESCVAQDYKPLEVIVYDDASTDGTAEAIRDEFPEVRLLTSDVQRGLIVRRNQGFADAGGEFVFSIDDDAYFTDPDTVARTVELFRLHPRAAAVAIPYTEPCGDRGSGRMQPCDVGTPLRSYTGCAHALRRQVVLQLGGYRELLVHQGEERDFCLRMLDAGWGVIYGDTSPIIHLYSPKRSQARLNYYGFRNTLLITWLNVPHPYVVPRLAIDSLQLFRHRLTITSVPHHLRLILSGWLACLLHWKDRHPVQRKTYRRFRALTGHGPLEPRGTQVRAVLRRERV